MNKKRVFGVWAVLLTAAALVSASTVSLPAQSADAAILKGNWPVTDSSRASTQACADVLFVGVRGSGETDGYGRTVRGVRDSIKKTLDSSVNNIRVRQIYVGYTAASTDVLGADIVKYGLTPGNTQKFKYFASIEDGVSKLRKVLNDSLTRCKNHPEKWVLAGYSQGALVIDMAQGYSAKNYAGVFLVGDPANYSKRVNHKYGTASSIARGIYDLAIHTQPTAEMKKVTYSYCNAYDLVCDSVASFNHFSAFTVVPRGTAIHTSYSASKLNSSLAAIKLELLRINPPVNTPTSTPTPKPTTSTPPSPDTVVQFPDANLSLCIRNSYARATGISPTTVTRAQVASLKEIRCEWGGIADLSGLECATGATSLALQEKWVPHAALQHLSAISNLTQLQYLQLSWVNDLTPLSKLKSLKQLTLSSGSFVDLTPVSAMTQLQTLQLTSSSDGGEQTATGGFSDIKPVASLPALNSLLLQAPTLRDFSAMKGYAEKGVAMTLRAYSTLPATKAGVPYRLPTIVSYDGSLATPALDQFDSGVIADGAVTWDSSVKGTAGLIIFSDDRSLYRSARVYLTQAVQ